MNITEMLAVETQRQLEERASQLARPPAESDLRGGLLDLVSFKLANENYAVSSRHVREIQPLKKHHWSPVPCAPVFITGAISLRGRIYSIMDIGRLLGAPDRPLTHTAHILLVHGGRMEDGYEMELTILTDNTPVIVQAPADSLEPSPISISAKAQEYIQGIIGEIIVLNLEKILSDPQIIVLDET